MAQVMTPELTESIPFCVPTPAIVVALLPLSYLIYCYIISRYDRLSHIPGPRLAAMGSWYERIFAPGHRFIKAAWPSTNAHPMLSKGMFGTRHRKPYKDRKAVHAWSFAKVNIVAKEEIFHEKVKRLMKRYSSFSQNGDVVDIGASMRCLNLEIVEGILTENTTNALDIPDFKHPILQGIEGQLETMHLFRHFPWLCRLYMSLPEWLVCYLSPHTMTMAAHRNNLEKQIQDLRNKGEKFDPGKHPTLLRELFTSEESLELTNEQICDDYYSFIFAGIDTPAYALRCIVWYVGRYPEVQQRLVDEVQSWFGNSPLAWGGLEKLPYLTGVIKEALRLGGVSPGKIIREVPEEGAQFGSIYLPPGAHVGMSLYLVNMNEDLFPKPDQFIPERWIGEEASRIRGFPASFGAGTRMCLGIHVAWSMLYLTTAYFFREYEVKIADTTEWDMGFKDHFSAKSNGTLKAVLRTRDGSI